MENATGGENPGDSTDQGVDFAVKERAMDEAPVGITITDPNRPDNPLVYVNESFEEITGYAREDIIGRNCRFLQGEETDDEHVAELAAAVAEESTVSVELLNYRADGEPFWNEVKIAPLEDADGNVTHFVGFQMDVTERHRAQETVRREREHLEHVLDRIEGLLADVTDDVVSATDRTAIEWAVVERLVETDTFESAWIGHEEPVEGRITPSAWAGDSDHAPADLGVDTDRTDDPVAAAFASGDARPARTLPGPGGAGVVIPLVYRGTTYGVLVVTTASADALHERELVVLQALGRTIATAMSVHESRRIITADNVVEIGFEIRDPTLFFVATAEQADCTLEYRGSVYRADGPITFFAPSGDPKTALASAKEAPGVETADLLGDGDRALLEIRSAQDSFVTWLADRGATTESITAEGGSARVDVELPASANARQFVDEVEDRYDGVQLVRFAEEERPPTTEGEFIAELESTLTDRQYDALHRAYVSGYYEWNRRTNGEDLAASMDISRSTFHQHLRAAERKLLAEFFDR